MKRLLALTAFLGAGLTTTDRAQAAPVEVDGRLSFRSLLSADAPNNPTTFISFLEADAHAIGLTQSELGLVIDATFILDATETNERRFGETERLDQVRNLYLEQPLGRVTIRAGRRVIPEAGNAWVDGVDVTLKVMGEQARIGLYGGLAPDPFDRAFNTTFQAGGLYGVWETKGITSSVGYNAVLRDTALDRQFAFNRTHLKLAEGLFFSNYLVVDFVEDPAITTLLATLDYTPIKALNLTLNASRYSIEQYLDQRVYRNVIEPNQALLLGDEVIDLIYNRVRFSASLRCWGSAFHYQSIEYKHRSQDGREAFLYTIGIRDSNLFGWGTEVDVHTQLVNNFQSDSVLVALDVRQDVGASATLGARATWFDGRTIGRATQRGRAFDEAQQIVLIGVLGTWRVNKQHHLDLNYDGIIETELQDLRNGQNLVIHTGMFRYSWLY